MEMSLEVRTGENWIILQNRMSVIWKFLQASGKNRVWRRQGKGKKREGTKWCEACILCRVRPLK